MRQRILGSHTPPCHRRMVITTQSSMFALLHYRANQLGMEGGGGGLSSLRGGGGSSAEEDEEEGAGCWDSVSESDSNLFLFPVVAPNRLPGQKFL